MLQNEVYERARTSREILGLMVSFTLASKRLAFTVARSARRIHLKVKISRSTLALPPLARQVLGLVSGVARKVPQVHRRGSGTSTTVRRGLRLISRGCVRRRQY